MTQRQRRAQREQGSRPKQPLSVVHAIFPGGWIGAIGLVVLMCGLAIAAYHFLTPPLPQDTPARPLETASYVAFDGSVQGGSVELETVKGDPIRQIALVPGQGYKVHVVYRSSGPGAIHYVRSMIGWGGNGRYGGGWRWSVQGTGGETVLGPAIICTGVNRYAVVAAPRTERGADMNTIHFSDDQTLDASLYSADCKAPDAAIIDRLAKVAGVTLPH